MRKVEVFIIVVAVVAFVTILGSGAIDHYITDFQTGLSVLGTLAKNSTQTAGLIGALVVAIFTLTNSKRGRKKRKK